MCGRFTLRVPASVVAEQFAILEVPELAPRFNIAPTQAVAAVRMAVSSAASRRPERELVFLQWGLIPSWAEDRTIGNRLINARSEGVDQKPAFRAALRRRRCLVVADGFYEWRRDGRRRLPYFIRMRDDRPFGFAGLWESWEGPDHSAIESCTLLTTDANEVVRPIHDRMPVIIPSESCDAWLDPAVERPDTVLPLLKPYPAEAMTAFAVSTLVNSPAHEDPRCIERVEDSRD